MGQQNNTAAAAHLADHFTQRVAECLPLARAHALASPVLFTGWLYRAAGDRSSAQLGPIDDGELLFVASLGVPTLLTVLLDRRQPTLVAIAARDALAGHFLADADIAATVQREAEGMARRAIAHAALQQDQLRRAERQSLYGMECASVAPFPAATVSPELAALMAGAKHEIDRVCGIGGAA